MIASIDRLSRRKRAFVLPGLLIATLAAGIPLSEALADSHNDGWFRFGKKRHAHLNGAEELAPGYATLARANIEPTKQAIARYRDIVARGGWPQISFSRKDIRPGSRGRNIIALRQRLTITGDLPEGVSGRQRKFDYRVEEAVRRFQYRHGLKPTGVINRRTAMALNVSASARLAQLKRNLSRLQGLAQPASKRYVVVNIPAAQIEAVEGGQVASRHIAVVGKIDRRTPVLQSRIHEINFNPYWNVPASIVRKDLVPQARQYARSGKDLLDIYKMEAFDGRGRKVSSANINWFSNAVYNYRFRQEPWEDNSLGFVKINFHNKHAVYLHDTPSKSLFNRNFRAHSSGCVRVQNVSKLVGWLLGPNSGWNTGRVLEMKQTGERRDVRLKKKTSVFLAYVTAWSTPDGMVHFRRDIYKRDGVGVAAAQY